MAIGDLDSGARFGLPPIGLPHAELNTERTDTERRAFPGLATKGSVFAWTSTAPVLANSAATVTETVNMRQNTATGGSSVDVPTWAAGCLLQLSYTVSTMGTSTYHDYYVAGNTGVFPAGSTLWADQRTAVTGGVGSIRQQMICPFYDEPSFNYHYGTNGTGTGVFVIILLGFVRNV